jgi:hypothetical protein
VRARTLRIASLVARSVRRPVTERVGTARVSQTPTALSFALAYGRTC